MTIRLDDERLTAYVLGEVDDDERRAIEAALEDDEKAREAVATLRATIELATEALADEPAGSLTEEQRGAIEAQAATPEVGTAQTAHRDPTRRSRWPWLAAAAGLLLLLGVGAVSVKLHMVTRPLSVVLATGADQPAEDAMPVDEGRLALVAEPSVDEQLRALGYIDAGDGVGDAAGVEVAMEPTEGRRTSGKKNKKGRTHGRTPPRQASLDSRQSPMIALDPEPDKALDPNGWNRQDFNTEAYDAIVHNPFKAVANEQLSTFSIDVDTASYANVRRYLDGGSLPPAGSVRIEEMVNYFSYDYAPPTGDDPFSAHVEVAGCPWAPDHRLARIGLKGWEMANDERPASNLVFLLDVSGSMNSANKLPLLKQAMKLLVQQLGRRDRVAIVVYAGASGLVLDSTSCSNPRAIEEALDRLSAGGSTNGGAGIQLAYDTAAAHFIDGGVNRVILATDGDFNIGTTNQGDLIQLIEDKAKTGVFLTVLGFGMGNYKDSTLEKLADKGNGNYAYIDTELEARKVLVEQISGTLVTIAKDVKIQVEFNPEQVAHYRLIGYENRLLAAEDFNDDTKDAGEIGAGHTVTALYELVPPGVELKTPGVDPLKYQQPGSRTDAAYSGELMTLKLRYKQPDGDTSKLLEFPVRDAGNSYAAASADFKFAASVAAFGMILRDSPHKGSATYDAVIELAGEGATRDDHGYRAEFLSLVHKARRLSR